jgi:hypothetical protein
MNYLSKSGLYCCKVTENKKISVIARSVRRDKAISLYIKWDCFAPRFDFAYGSAQREGSQ